MALSLGTKTLEVIVDGFKMFSRQYPGNQNSALVAEIYLSVGEKVRDADGNIVIGPQGQEAWKERYQKLVHVSTNDLGNFLIEVANPESQYNFVPSGDPNPLLRVDEGTVGWWYAVAAWMIDTGRVVL